LQIYKTWQFIIFVANANHESIITRLRENVNHIANDLQDAGTSDFITGLMETHEKMAWMLRAHLR